VEVFFVVDWVDEKKKVKCGGTTPNKTSGTNLFKNIFCAVDFPRKVEIIYLSLTNF